MSQFNVRLSDEFKKIAEQYVKKHGYKNLQELAKDALRSKIFEEESVKESLEIMKNKELMASIKRSREDVRKGKTITFSSVKELRKRYK